MCTPVFGKCVLCSIPDGVVFQCTLVCRENDIPEARQWRRRFTDRRKFCLILYAMSLASAWVAAIGSRGRHDIVNESPSCQRKAYRQPCYCDARKPDLPVQINQFALRGHPRAATTFHIRNSHDRISAPSARRDELGSLDCSHPARPKLEPSRRGKPSMKTSALLQAPSGQHPPEHLSAQHAAWFEGVDMTWRKILKT
ncbi:hypothetical protein ACVWW4_004090 [Bradyrhizobium sp. LB7.1]